MPAIVSPALHLLPTASAARRWGRWMLLAWLLAVGCAGSAPFVAPFAPFTPTLDCVTHKRQKPAAQGPVSHLLECSQCLPAAPPGASPEPTPHVQRAVRAAAAPRAPEPAFAFVFPSPPARAPPLTSFPA